MNLKSFWEMILSWFKKNDTKPEVKLPDVKGHNACFLVANGSVRMMNILSPKLLYDNFKTYVNQQKELGANFVYLYTIDEKDGGWTPFSFYQGNSIGGTVDEAVVQDYQKRLQYIRDQNMGIVLWLRADDSPTFNKTARTQQLKYQADVVSYFDKYVSAYVVGLEADEYMNATTANDYAVELGKLTSKEIGIHQKPGKYDFVLQAGFDTLWYQYGFNKNASQIESDTKNVIAKIGGKKLYAAEYHLSSESEDAKKLGDAAMRGGASGTGNNRHV